MHCAKTRTVQEARSDVIDKKKVDSDFFPEINLISWRFALIGLSKKVKCFSAQQKLSPKGCKLIWTESEWFRLTLVSVQTSD